MIKVCHITSAHPPEDVRIFHKECVSLAKNGYQVYLVEQGASYEKNGVQIVGVGTFSGGRLQRMTSFANRVYRTALELDADIYHLHDPELLPYGLKLKAHGKKVIFDSHENYSEQIREKEYLPSFLTSLISRCYALYERFILKRIDAVIFPSPKDGINPFEGLCPRAELIYNVPMLHELYDKYDPTIAKYEQSICHVGSLTHIRGITHMIRAAVAADCTAHIAGTFSPESYEQQLREMPEFKHVSYKGEVGREQVLEILQRSQIGMATLLNVGQYNRYDDFPTKVYEYMALGLPVILSDSAYARQVLKTYPFGICVDPENVDEIAQSIRYLLDHPAEAQRMGENGRRAVKEEFNWGVEEKKLCALYEDILKN